MISELHQIVESAPDLAPNTRDKYLRGLNAWIEFAGADPRGWTQPQAQAFYNELVGKRGMRPQSAGTLFASLAYAAKWWAISKGDARLDFTTIRTIKGDRNKIAKRILTADQAAQLLGTCGDDPHGLRDFALIVIGLETGMRRFSLGWINFANLDDETAIARVPIKGSHGELVSIQLTQTAMRAMQPWRAWLGNPKRGFLCCPIRRGIVGARSGWRANPHDALTGAAIQKVLATRAQRAQIDHVHPHMFRHTFVTWRLDAGHEPHVIASVTHHTMNLGAFEGYINKETLATNLRDATPTWLRKLVEQRIPKEI